MPPKLGSALGLHIQQLAKGKGAAGPQVKSLEFTTLIKSIGECKAKVEEDAIIERERELLRKRLADPDIDKTRTQEYLMRALYVEMLGHTATFAHIYAVKATCEQLITTKKVGYLATALFLDDSSELLILIVNTLQQDLRSQDPLCVTAALTAVCKLVSGDAVSSVLPQVADCLKHPSDHVRKKAVMALHRFYQRSPATVAHMIPTFRQMLCDPDPSVMAATLCALTSVAGEDAAPFRNLVPSFVNILRQCIERKLPKGLDYPRTAKALPAPFVQIKLLKMLAVLGKGDRPASEQMYGVLAEALRAAENGTNIGNAIIAEAVKTAAAIWPNPALLAPAAEAVARFIRSKSNNLKYIGIDALCDIVVVSPGTAVAHQMAVLDCLEDSDVTLRRKTLDLLYRMVRPGNAEVICAKMLDYVRAGGVEEQTVEETCARVAEIAEKFAPSTAWFVTTMSAVFELGGPLVKPSLAHNLCTLLGEGAGGEGEEGAQADAQLRRAACDAYWALLARGAEGESGDGDASAMRAPPPLLLGVAMWTLGEYGVESGVAPCQALQAVIAAAAERHRTLGGRDAASVTGYAFSALAKLVGRHGVALEPEAAHLAAQAQRSRSTDLSQRAAELLALSGGGVSAELARSVLPFDASCKPGAVGPVDASLSFLDAHVQQALQQGCSPYLPAEARTTFANPVSAAAAAADAHGAEAGAGGARDRAGGAAAAAAELDIFGMGGGAPAQSYSQTYAMPPVSSPAAAAAAATPPPQAVSSEPTLNVAGGSKKWGRHTTVAPAPSPPQQPQHAGLGLMDVGGGGGGGQAAASIAAAQQRVLEEIDPDKARLANALFAGSGGGGGLFANRGARQHAAASAAAAAPELLSFASAPAPAQPSNSVMDLLGGLSVPAPVARPAAPPVDAFAGMHVAAAAPTDPFAAMASLTVPAPAAPAPAARKAIDLDALMGPPAPAGAGPAFAGMSFGAPSGGPIDLAALTGPPAPFPGLAKPAAVGAGGSLSGSGPAKGAAEPVDPFASLFS